MKLAIASGKSGTGKTTIATNLAWTAASSRHKVAYIDCDIEQPSGYRFLRPRIDSVGVLGQSHPRVDPGKCTLCGLCTEVCKHNAILRLGSKMLIYPELCHGSGDCRSICSSGAITEVFHEAGKLSQGKAEAIEFVAGELNTGEAMTAPLIGGLRETLVKADLQIIDCPPGTSSPVIESIRYTDMVLLVAESTAFGLRDLKPAIELLGFLKLPFAVIVNRAGAGNDKVTEYCRHNSIEILAEIAEDSRVAEAYSKDMLASKILPEFRRSMELLFSQLWHHNPVASPDITT